MMAFPPTPLPHVVPGPPGPNMWEELAPLPIWARVLIIGGMIVIAASPFLFMEFIMPFLILRTMNKIDKKIEDDFQRFKRENPVEFKRLQKAIREGR